MDSKTFNAILSMDAYNRGYNAGIKFGNLSGSNSVDVPGTSLGNAIIYDSRGDITARNANFYAVAYDYNGETIISYRGTDNPLGMNGDIVNGWVVGAGDVTDNQAELAFEFYNDVATQKNGGNSIDPRLADISLTGHSLGGGLAGLVGSVHDKAGYLFDTMPFKDAVTNVYDYSSVVSSNYNPYLRDLIYLGDTPWVPDLFDERIQSHSIKGEALSFLRETIVEPPYPPYDLGNNVDLPGNIITETVERHSMATLVIRLFAEDYSEVNNDLWRDSASHFWPVLYDNQFADDIGFKDTILGKKNTDQEYADILRQTIAYSAIDEGERPFGDTAIRALYDDANDLGAALNVSGVDSTIETYAMDISEAFVNFAGQLAFNAVLSENTPDVNGEDIAEKGILTYVNQGDNQTLSINLSNTYWEDILSNADHKADVARNSILSSVLNELPPIVNPTTTAASQLWDRDSNNTIDRVVFAVQQDSTTHISSDENGEVANTLFVAGNGNDTIYGSSSNEIIIGGQGDDVIHAGTGIDIIDGGAGYDELVLDSSHSYVNGKAILITDNVSAANNVHGVATNIEKYTVEEGTSGYFEIEKMGNIFEENATFLQGNTYNYLSIPESYTTLSYQNYNTSLKFYAERDWDKNTQFKVEDINGNIDYISTGSAIVGSNNGDIYGNTNIDASAGVQIPLGYQHLKAFTGSGDDIFYNNFSIKYYGRSVIYGGGDDIYVAPEPSSGQSPKASYSDTYLPLGVELADISFDIIKLDELDAGNGADRYRLYSGDTKVTIAGMGSITNMRGIYTTMDLVDPAIASPNVNWAYHVSIPSNYFIQTKSDVLYGFFQTDNESHYANGIYPDESEFVFKTFRNAHTASARNTFYKHAYQGTQFDETLDLSEWIAFNDFYAYGGNDIVLGSAEENKIYAGSGNDNVQGKDGDDELYGGVGNDILDGGNGNDFIQGGIGNDELIGGAGNDIYFINAADGVNTIFDSSGDDMIIFGRGFYQSNMIETLVGNDIEITFTGNSYDKIIVKDYLTTSNVIENYYFSPSGRIEDLIFGEEGDDVINGTAGNDYIYSLSGDDRLLGGDGNDILDGGIGDDTLRGDAGEDTLYGGDGLDTLYGDIGNDILDGGAGDDAIWADAGDDTLYGGDGLDTLYGGIGSDVLYGGAENDQLSGHNGDDTLYGGDGSDRIYGGDGNDILYGGAGDDELVGDEGDDILDGGTGDDGLWGKEGNDTLIYTRSKNLTVDEYFDGGFGSDRLIVNLISSEYTSSVQSEVQTFTNKIINSGNAATTGNFSGWLFGNDFYAYNIEKLNVFVDGNRVAGTNDNPVAFSEIFQTEQNQTVQGNVLVDNGNGADIDADGDILTVQVENFTTANGATVVLNENGNFTYTPTIGFIGTDSFMYALEDGQGGSDIGSVNITVTSVYPAGAIVGTENDDVLIDSSSDDLIYGLGGNDRFVYTAGSDVYNGGAGSDTADFSQFDKAIWVDLNYAGIESWHRNGTDLLTGTWESMADLLSIENIIGTAYDDGLNGDAGANVISGGAGDDYLYGNAGDDRFVYTSGADRVNGGTGSDTADFSQFDKAIWVDLNYAGIESWHRNGTDLLTGTWESMADLLSIENIIGTAYDDGLYGNAGVNVISGGAGDDVIFAGSGNDTSYGDAGDDRFVYGAGSDVLNGGAGTDTADFSEFGKAIWVDLNYVGIESWHRNGTDLLTGTWESMADLTDIENIIGTAYDDGLNGDAGANVISGGAGDDYLYGNAGDDRFVYTSGADEFNGGAGSDTADFSLFDKAIWVDLTYAGIESWHRNGTDLLSGAWESMADLTNIENVIGTAYDDGLYGNAGANVISGGAGDDVIFAGAGNDTSYGDAGDDRFVYGSGSDVLNGGAGTDTADFSEFGKAIWVDLSYVGIESWHRNGTDLLTGAWESMADLTDIENIIGTAYDDGLYGNAGVNVISGGAGDDVIFGLDGDDKLHGGSGLDVLYGNDGADTFIFEAASAFGELDNVEDFSLAQGDKLDLSDLLESFDPLTDLITDFVQIVDSGSNSIVSVDADGGADNFLQVAQLSNITGLTDEDALVTNGTLIV